MADIYAFADEIRTNHKGYLSVEVLDADGALVIDVFDNEGERVARHDTGLSGDDDATETHELAEKLRVALDQTLDENRITIDKMFGWITPLAIKTYNGKQVIFIVPSEPVRVQDFQGITVIEENAKTYEEKRRFVSDVVLKHPADKIIVLTQSEVVLSDAFREQIYTWRKAENGLRYRYIGGLSTFGASPSRIALHVFNVPESIGSLSDATMDKWLETQWTADRAEELEAITDGISGGWPRAKLQEIYEQLTATPKA